MAQRALDGTMVYDNIMQRPQDSNDQRAGNPTLPGRPLPPNLEPEHLQKHGHHPDHFLARQAARARMVMGIGHATVLGLIFFPPFALCLSLGLNPDVNYFVGRWALLAVGMVPACIAVSVIHVSFWRPRSGFFFLATLWLPAIAYTVIGGFMRERTGIVKGALDSYDCLGFDEKRNLRRAYEAAQGAYNLCALRPGYETASVSDCPEYKNLEKSWKRQLDYLAATEYRLPCAGICGGSESRLWFEAGIPTQACGPFIAQWMRGAYTQAETVLLYGLMVIVLSIPVFLYIIYPMLVHLYYPIVEKGLA